MSGHAPGTAMPQHVAIRVDVGGKVFRTSLHTLMEGARLKGDVFQALCLQILGPGGGSPWEQRVVPAQNPQYGGKHFVDADPTPWPCWLEYLRSGEVPFVEAGPLRDRVISATRSARGSRSSQWGSGSSWTGGATSCRRCSCAQAACIRGHCCAART